jgi:pimeloyl-ACP methyl ester carboxylesterase
VHVPNLRTGQQLPLHYQLVEDYQANRPRLDIAHNVGTRLSQPLLLVHGDQDETVAVDAAHALHQLRPDAELLLVPGAGHMFGGAHPWRETELPPLARLIAERTADFFRRTL